jgi:hypothetical protein
MADVKEYRLRLYVGVADRAVTALRRLGRVAAYRVRSGVIDVVLHAESILDMDDESLPIPVRVATEPVWVFLGPTTEPEQTARVLTRE